jgi:uncharacterized FlaG/YvyC family protein
MQGISFKAKNQKINLENFGFKWNHSTEIYQTASNRRNKKMVNIRQMASTYEAPETKNIADLEKFSLDLEIETKEFRRKEPKAGESETFSINVVTIDDQEYRVPTTVIGQIKVIMQNQPEVKEVKVIKSGSGFNTKYQVLAL